MKIKIYFLLFCICYNSLASQNATRETITLNYDWKFSKGNHSNAFKINYNDAQWESVKVPHDWAIYGPFDKEIDKQVIAITQNGEKVPTEKTGRTASLPHIGSAWYRKHFNINQNDINKKIILQFDGAMSEPEVFLNGKKIGEVE